MPVKLTQIKCILQALKIHSFPSQGNYENWTCQTTS